jgi:hypothetical protein
MRIDHLVVVFDAADLAAESRFWAGVLDGTVESTASRSTRIPPDTRSACAGSNAISSQRLSQMKEPSLGVLPTHGTI